MALSESEIIVFPKFTHRLQDSNELVRYLKMAGEFMLGCYQEEILTGGHGEWQALSLRTIVEKIGLGSPTAERPLQRFGGLLASLEPGHYNNIMDINLGQDIHTLDVGTADPVGAFHQRGDESSNTPARPFVRMRPDELNELDSICSRWASGEL